MVSDAEGQIVYTSGQLDTAGLLAESAYQYRSLPVDRAGNHVWRHDLFRMVGKASENVVKAGESDVISYEFAIPYWARSPLSVSAVLKYRKFNTRYAVWALKEEYQPLPVVDMARHILSLPIRVQPEATDMSVTSP